MQYFVELAVHQRDFIGSMERMRTWFDHLRVEPDGFRHVSDRTGITFRLEFRTETDAVSFAQAFGGRLIGAETADPEAPSLEVELVP